jgi:acyl-CoA synthetase (AMP-forming)/AMP-acid ligase II
MPLKFAVPAITAFLAYLNARWSFFYDWRLLSTLASFTVKMRMAERRDRLSLFYILENHALSPKSANRPFILYNGRTWTYHEAYQTVLRYGQYFKSTYGVQAKELVAMDFMNSANFIFIWMGLLSIGATPAFINYNLGGKPLTHCVKVSTARLLIVDEEVHDRFTDEHLAAFASPDFRDGKGPVQVVFFTPEVEVEILQQPAIREDDSVRSSPEPRDPAMLIYTSGTTGLPKPAIISWLKCWSGGRFIVGWLGIRTDDRVYTVRNASSENYCHPTDGRSVCHYTIPQPRS